MTLMAVAPTGGHLKELHVLLSRLAGVPVRCFWVTSDSPQSRSLLAGEDVEIVRHTAPRDVVSAAVDAVLIERLLRRRRVEAVLASGAGMAGVAMVVGRMHRLPCYYVDSATRTVAPSLTGRILEGLPGVELYSQYEWPATRWTFLANVFDGFRPALSVERRPIRRAVVSLGTQPGHGFRRLVLQLADLLPSDAEVLWQVGPTEVPTVRGDVRRFVPARELLDACRGADLVVTHAGVGSTLMALEAGRIPLVVPRLAKHGEHVDDHQLRLAGELETRGLAIPVRPERLTADDLGRAASMSAERSLIPSPLSSGAELLRQRLEGHLSLSATAPSAAGGTRETRAAGDG